ncbi:MAG: tol-pal system YbgF family protein, partial [bacterium]
MQKIISEFIYGLLILMLFTQAASGSDGAKIVKMSGEVKVRKGLDENWSAAHIGMLLDDIDTILTLEASIVVLKLQSGETFRLASNAIVDIGDLRKITERELFLFLMSQKMDKMKPNDEKAKLRITNVSVVRAANKATKSKTGSRTTIENRQWLQEMNGAKAMYFQSFYPNAIMKLHKILQKNPDMEQCCEIFFYLAKSYEEIDKPGRALQAYRIVVANAKNEPCNTVRKEDMVAE